MGICALGFRFRGVRISRGPQVFGLSVVENRQELRSIRSGIQGLPGPEGTYLFGAPYYDSLIYVLKKGRFFRVQVGFKSQKFWG